MKVQLTRAEKAEHWLNFIFLLVILIYLTLSLAMESERFPYDTLVVVLVFLVFLKHKVQCVKLDSFKPGLTEDQFIKANHAAALRNNWLVLSNTENYFEAIIRTDTIFDGVKITAIHKNGMLYLNSMVNPSIRSNPFAFRLNKKSKLELTYQYRSILRGNDPIEIVTHEMAKRAKEFREASEWTFKKTLLRILIYLLSISFFSLAVWAVFSSQIEGVVLAIMILSFSGPYIYYDIKILLKKKKRL